MDEPVIAFESPAAWEEWLAGEHGSQNGEWVKIAKQATGVPTVTHAEALDAADAAFVAMLAEGKRPCP